MIADSHNAKPGLSGNRLFGLPEPRRALPTTDFARITARRVFARSDGFVPAWLNFVALPDVFILARPTGRWNSASDFIFFARRAEMVSNCREDHEISMPALHLLKNCMVSIN